ncbi:MAG: hypothetical protein U0894_15995 [Pirellulales bacterium]
MPAQVNRATDKINYVNLLADLFFGGREVHNQQAPKRESNFMKGSGTK